MRTLRVKISFLPYSTKEWNKLDSENRNAETYTSFRKMLLNFITPIYDHELNCGLVLAISLNTNLNITFLTHLIRDVLALWKLRLQFIFFYAVKIVLLYAEHWAKRYWWWHYYVLSENVLLHVIMYGNKNSDNNMNVRMLTVTIKFIEDSKGSDQPLFQLILKPFTILFKKSVALQLEFWS